MSCACFPSDKVALYRSVMDQYLGSWHYPRWYTTRRCLSFPVLLYLVLINLGILTCSYSHLCIMLQPFSARALGSMTLTWTLWYCSQKIPSVLFSTADSPGSASMLCMVGHSGKFSCCLYCDMPGRHRNGDSHYYPVMQMLHNYEVEGCCHPYVTGNDLATYRSELPQKYTAILHTCVVLELRPSLGHTTLMLVYAADTVHWATSPTNLSTFSFHNGNHALISPHVMRQWLVAWLSLSWLLFLV